LPNKSFGEKVKALDYGYSDFHSQEAPTKVIVGSERGGVSIPTVISAVYSLDIKDGHMLWSRTFGTTATSGTSGVSVASRKLLNVMSVQDKNADNSSDVYAVFSNYNSSTGKTTQYRFMLDGTTGADLWHDTGMFNGIAPEFVFEGNNNNQPLTTADIDGDGMTDTVESPIPGVVHASY
jgi:outer membrane protein assembly factor BamB